MSICHCAPYEGTDQYVFISYCRKDSDMVYPILDRMGRAGYRIWYDNGIHTGSEWPEVIAAHLQKSAAVMLFLTQAAIGSHNCRNEALYALEMGKPLVPVMLEGTALTPGMRMNLGSVQWLKVFSPPTESNVREILECPVVKGCRGLMDNRIPETPLWTGEKKPVEKPMPVFETGIVQETPKPEPEVPVPAPKPEPAPTPQPEPVPPAPAPVHATQPESEIPAPAPAPVPQPDPESPAPAPVPQPEPESPAPAPAPQPDPVPPTPAPQPEPVPPAPAPVPATQPEPEIPAPAPAPVPQPEPESPAPAPVPQPEPESPAPAPAPQPDPVPPTPAPQPEPVPPAPAPVPATQPEPEIPAPAPVPATQPEPEIRKPVRLVTWKPPHVPAPQPESESPAPVSAATTKPVPAPVPSPSVTGKDRNRRGDKWKNGGKKPTAEMPVTEKPVWTASDLDTTTVSDLDATVKEDFSEDLDSTVVEPVEKPPVVLDPNGGKRYRGKIGETVLGRNAVSDIVIPDPDKRISKKHCSLISAGNAHVVLDLDAPNGTFVNGERLESGARMNVPDLFELGMFKTRLLVGFGAEADRLSRCQCLVSLQSEETGEVRYLIDGQMELGRAHAWKSGALSSQSISHNHATIRLAKEGASITDHSRNGTWVNDQHLTSGETAPLQTGDSIRLGSETFIVRVTPIKEGKKP